MIFKFQFSGGPACFWGGPRPPGPPVATPMAYNVYPINNHLNSKIKVNIPIHAHIGNKCVKKHRLQIKLISHRCMLNTPLNLESMQDLRVFYRKVYSRYHGEYLHCRHGERDVISLTNKVIHDIYMFCSVMLLASIVG